VGINAQTNKARTGRKKFPWMIFCRPCRGLKLFGDQTHGFTVDYFLPRLRRWGRPVLNPTRTARKGSSRSAARWALTLTAISKSYMPHEYIGIYTQKAVRLIGRVVAIYDSEAGAGGQMQLTLVDGIERPDFRERIKGMATDSKQKLGWDLSSDMRFFCADRFLPTDFEKVSSGGIRGPLFWDISEQVEKAGADDSKLAELLRNQKWE
jgi:hypothetical protein